MKPKILLTLCLLLILSYCELDKKTIRLVHNNSYHNLFGGNGAVNDTHYQYHELKQTLQQIINKPKYRVFSISLLSSWWPPIQVKYNYIQDLFYNVYPGRPNQAVIGQQGNRQVSFHHHYPVCGSYINPKTIPSFLHSKIIALSSYIPFCNSNNLQKIFETIDRQMSYQLNSNIYVHSYDGLDQVSYVLGAYLMKTKGDSLETVMKDILKFYKSIGHKNMGSTMYWALQWYCLKLGRTPDECLLVTDGNNANNYEL